MMFCKTDAQSILSELKRQEKQIKLKRRWLLGIPTTNSERKKLNKIFKIRYLPESLLREDDIFYESVRTHVEGAFGAHCIERENNIPLDDMSLIQIPNMKRLTLSCLDILTTKGLYNLAMIVMGGSVNSEITCAKAITIINWKPGNRFSNFSPIRNIFEKVCAFACIKVPISSCCCSKDIAWTS
ncbi:hypothetical protein SESBI_21972 [Sesbania bispinosa]|nr:hypothetical protein SESBI_21972 [Sesbania bispinosa]